ncbi:MAG: hypothetical protein FWG41_03830 [Methanomassiliicoccaceae archaeon]|nr:hypothetical protein [Methanomassiliicoccaceae archaeon]
MKGYCFLVNGDPVTARDTVYGILTDQGFTLTPIDEWSADAERGSQGKSILLGGFAGKKGRHVKLQIICRSGSEGFTFTLIPGTSGASGGLVGVSQADKIYADVYNAVGTAFKNAGVLISDNPLK